MASVVRDETVPRSLEKLFRERFAATPRLYRAPGRVNLIGEHTDYNDGFVLPAAIDLAAWVAGRARPDRTLVVHAVDLDRGASFDLDDTAPVRAGDWTDYVRGVAIELARAGHRLSGADLLVASEVPIGAGLSSSAALEVAVAWALLDLTGITPDPLAVARLCQAAENRFVGARCGVMDQFAASHGRADHALHLDCRTLEARAVPLPEGVALVVCDSLVQHALATGEYNRRRAECEQGVAVLARHRSDVRALRDATADEVDRHRDELGDVLHRRCRHVVAENARVASAVAALERADVATLGSLLVASHASLRDDYEVSCPELDLLVETATRQPGVHGSRMLGGGFGGSTLSLVVPDAVPDVAAAIGERYRRAYGRVPHLRVCRAADGARRWL